MQWVDDIEREIVRMTEQWKSDEPYFEAGEDLGVAIEMNAKLIAALKVAEEALDRIDCYLPMKPNRHDNVPFDEVIRLQMMARNALTKLQSGEFGGNG